MKKHYHFIVVGGGFFGCRMALTLKKLYEHKNILILEKAPELMLFASYVNQARVHNGYHYPRSITTALRSRVNFSRYLNDYGFSVYDSFKKYYAVAKLNSKVTANQFKIFFERIEAPIRKAPNNVKKYFNSNTIEEVFEVQEYAFDSTKLKEQTLDELEKYEIPIAYSTRADSVTQGDDGIDVAITDLKTNEKLVLSCKYLFNCTYANINTLLHHSNLEKINLRQEIVEMVMVDVPPPFDEMGITIMDGPFFSVMPFPSRSCHSFYHVRLSRHKRWLDRDVDFDNDTFFASQNLKSNFKPIILDAQRFVPVLSETKYRESLWVLRTILPASQFDDSRPILLQKDVGIKNLFCVMGGKIDNVYDVEEEINYFDLN